MTNGTIYIIHFAMPDGVAEHFVGITRRTSLHRRLIEHRSKPETSHLADLFKRSTEQTVEGVMQGATEAHERFLKNQLMHEREETVCPICRRLSIYQKKKEA